MTQMGWCVVKQEIKEIFYVIRRKFIQTAMINLY